MKLFTGDKVIYIGTGGVQLFFTNGGYTGSNILGNPSPTDWATINSIIEVAQIAPTVDTTNGLYNGSDHAAGERATGVQ